MTKDIRPWESARQPSGVNGFWQMLERAAMLYRADRRELIRHASVSIDNRHKCRSCFTCACAEVWRNKGQISPN